MEKIIERKCKPQKKPRREWTTTLPMIPPPIVDDPKTKTGQLEERPKRESLIQYATCPKCGQETILQNIQNTGLCGRCWYKQNVLERMNGRRVAA